MRVRSDAAAPMPKPSKGLGYCLLVVALAALGASRAGAVPPVDSNLGAAANGGGCYPSALHPSLFDMITLVNPEWAPVVKGSKVDSEPVLVHGTVEDMHGDTGGDFPGTHVRSDVNQFVKLDPEDEGRLATGNDDGLLAFEWEAGTLPAFAWSGPGDRIVGLGRWIFDCGHPGAIPGRCSKTSTQECVINTDCPATETCIGTQYRYSSELHPPYATAVIRQGRGALLVPPYRSAIPATRVDIYASVDSGGAGDRCVLTHRNNPNVVVGTNCYPLSQPIAPLNSRDFEFSVPLPPKPANGQLAMRLQRYATPGGVAAFIDTTPRLEGPDPHVDVRVRLTGSSAVPTAPLPTGFAGTLFAGWRYDTTPLTHVRVTLVDLTIRNALQPVTPTDPKSCALSDQACSTDADCGGSGPCQGVGPVKSWQLQVGVNGEWKEIPGLERVSTGDVIPLGLAYDQYLRPGGSLRLQSTGSARECATQMFGKSIGTNILELGLAGGTVCLASTEHSPGSIDETRSGPDFGAGPAGTTYQTVSVGGEGGVCAAAPAQVCLLDADCGNAGTCVRTGGAMALRYRVERLPR